MDDSRGCASIEETYWFGLEAQYTLTVAFIGTTYAEGNIRTGVPYHVDRDILNPIRHFDCDILPLLDSP